MELAGAALKLSASRRRTLEWAVLGVALWRAVGVRWAPVVTEDSLGYLQRGRAPFSTGFVVDGYRQLGYPLWLWLVESVAGPLGIDRLFAIVVAQRLLLVAAVVLLWRVLRLWSVPVLFAVTSLTTVAYTNFVLNEGLLVPLAVAAAACLIGAVSHVAPLMAVPRPSHPLWWLVGALAVVAAATMLKLQYAALGLGILPALGAMSAAGVRVRRAVIVGGAMAVLLGVMVVGQTVENARENHDLTPVSEQAHAQWWGAYHAVFSVSPELANRVEVQPFREDGFESFYFPLLRSQPDYRDRRRLTTARVEQLFEAAGTTRREEHLKSFLGGLQGGRFDDLSLPFYLPEAVGGGPQWSGLRQNSLARSGGVPAVIDQFNDGVVPAVWAPGAILESAQRLGDVTALNSVLAILGLCAALTGVRLRGRVRWVGPTAVFGSVVGAAVLASGYIDIQRYLLPYVLFVLSVGSWAVGTALAQRDPAAHLSDALPCGTDEDSGEGRADHAGESTNEFQDPIAAVGSVAPTPPVLTRG